MTIGFRRLARLAATIIAEQQNQFVYRQVSFLSDRLGDEDEHVELDLINVDLDTSIGACGTFVDLVSYSDNVSSSVSVVL